MPLDLLIFRDGASPPLPPGIRALYPSGKPEALLTRIDEIERC
jgi:hypothetical protein